MSSPHVRPHASHHRSNDAVSSPAKVSRRSRASRAILLGVGMSLFTACSDDQGAPTGDVPAPVRSLSVVVDNSTGSAVSLAPKSATLVQGHGVFLKAQVLDAAGAVIAGARATWRTTNPQVALVQALADSGLVSDHGRAAVASIAPGTALIIAQYEGMADTARITIIARTDSAPGTPSTPPQRAREFTLSVRVQGVLATTSAGDSASRHQLLPGSQVTLTLLPLLPRDSVSADTPRITTPTVIGTVTTDASGVAHFRNVTVSRYRVSVQPPAGTGWIAAVTESAPPYWSSITQEVWLRRP